jgi:hypothetical protein
VAMLILGSVDVGWSVGETKRERSPAGPTHVTMMVCRNLKLT